MFLRTLAALSLIAVAASAQESTDGPVLVATLEGPVGHVARLAFSQDGKMLATAGHDRTVRVFETATWEQRVQLPTNGSQQFAVAFSPDGKYLAASGDFAVRVFGVKKLSKKKINRPWKMLEEIEVADGRSIGATVWDLAFSKDSKTLAAATFAGTVQLWAARKWEPVATLEGHEASGDGNNLVEFVDWASDGKALVSGGKTAETIVWTKKSRRAKWKAAAELEEDDDGPPAHRMCAQFSPDGAVLAIGGTDGVLQIVDGSDWSETKRIRAFAGDFVHALAFAPDGSRLFVSAKTIKIYDTDDWELLETIEMPAVTHELAISADGRFLATAAFEDKVRVYRIAAER